MLETEIKKLREAIEANTEALMSVSTNNTKSAIQTNPEDRKDPENPEAQDETIEEPNGNSEGHEITQQVVRDLAKVRITEGHSRADLKEEIENLGADSIAGLDQKSLEEFYKKLLDMKKDDSI